MDDPNLVTARPELFQAVATNPAYTAVLEMFTAMKTRLDTYGKNQDSAIDLLSDPEYTLGLFMPMLANLIRWDMLRGTYDPESEFWTKMHRIVRERFLPEQPDETP
jgi:hypothetical protein